MHATKIASFTMNGFFAHYPTFQNTECHRNALCPNVAPWPQATSGTSTSAQIEFDAVVSRGDVSQPAFFGAVAVWAAAAQVGITSYNCNHHLQPKPQMLGHAQYLKKYNLNPCTHRCATRHSRRSTGCE